MTDPKLGQTSGCSGLSPAEIMTTTKSENANEPVAADNNHKATATTSVENNAASVDSNPSQQGKLKNSSTAADESLIDKLLREFPVPRKPEPASNSIRFMTFNINGFKTLFNYYPWNKILNLQNFFHFLDVDIISLQELKTSRENVNNAIAKIPNYYNFITLPSQKKGYSGVGVYIRKPTPNDSPYTRNLLTVRKVEEGITGYLRCYDYKIGSKTYKDIHDIANRAANSSTTNTTEFKKFTTKHIIGGYANLFDRDKCLEIDSQGRCIVIELGYNLVVFSLYCPANSQRTAEGEVYRLDFLKLLFARVRNLKNMGKKVLVMGDINISRDLIDSGEAIQHLYEEGLIKKVDSSKSDSSKSDSSKSDTKDYNYNVPGVLDSSNQDGSQFEKLNEQQAVNFSKCTIPRVYLNSIVHGSYLPDEQIAIDTSHNILPNDETGKPIQTELVKDLFVNSDDEDEEEDEEIEAEEQQDIQCDDPLSRKRKIPIKEVVRKDHFLHDLVREHNGRRLKMYTCWNTIKNYRSINFGSRIDLVLCCTELRKWFASGNILPFLNGSDHCPVYCDFVITNEIASELNGQEVVSSQVTSVSPPPIQNSLSNDFLNDEEYVPKFEAKYVYGLNDLTIVNMFKNFNKYSILGKRKASEITNDSDAEGIKLAQKANRQEVTPETKATATTIDLTASDGSSSAVSNNNKQAPPSSSESSNSKLKKPVYVSRKTPKDNKKQKSISSFFQPVKKAKPEAKAADDHADKKSNLDFGLNSNINDTLFEQVKKGFVNQSDSATGTVDLVSSSSSNSSNSAANSTNSTPDLSSRPARGPISGLTVTAAKEHKPSKVLSFLGKKYTQPPLCHHKKECILRTSSTEKTRGKKFWCCSKISIRNNNGALRSNNGKLDEDISCGYFKWA